MQFFLKKREDKMSRKYSAFVRSVFGGRVGGCLLSAVGIILLSMVYSCNAPTSSNDNGQPKCPLFPQHSPVSAADPAIRIMSPNGGELFHIGEQCTVKVRSRYAPPGGAEMCISIDGRAYTIPQSYPATMSVATMEGDSVEFAKHGDSTVIANIFTIPDSLYLLRDTTKISSISEKCLIIVRAYSSPYYPDTTDCYFSIAK
jgi:hypothetical protein